VSRGNPWEEKRKLTDALVKRLVAAPPASGNRRRPHSELKNLALCVTGRQRQLRAALQEPRGSQSPVHHR
jgi:hypothetical protein